MFAYMRSFFTGAAISCCDPTLSQTYPFSAPVWNSCLLPNNCLWEPLGRAPLLRPVDNRWRAGWNPKGGTEPGLHPQGDRLTSKVGMRARRGG